MMKTLALLALSTLLLAACANTRQGISRDSEQFGDKVQRTSEIWTNPRPN